MIARAPGCLSDLRIDRMLAGDLEGGESARAREHLAGCSACGARVAAFEAARAVIPPDLEAIRRLAAAPPAATARRPWRAWWPSLGVALAVGAAALIVAVRPRAPDETTRIKGGPRLGFFVKHGDDVRRGRPGELVNPGDMVRFVVSTPQQAHLTIAGADSRGVVTVYFPVASVADTVAAGSDVVLPRATQLDDTLGPETISAYFCERRVDLTRDPPPGCKVDRIDWVKVPAP
jgi:hypothetical protein